MYNIVKDNNKSVLSCTVKNKNKVRKSSEVDRKNSTQTEPNSTPQEIITLTISNESNIDQTNEEYDGLSYKKSTVTPIKNNDGKEENEARKKSGDKDYRAKYKTEKCRYYETNKECKFASSV